MKSVKDLLIKFKNITPPDTTLRSAVAAAVTDVAGVPLSKKEVRISNGVAFITCSSVARNVIRTHRAAILSALTRDIPSEKGLIRDVR